MLSLVASLAFPPLPSILSCDERRLLETGDGQTETQTICITSPELDTIMYPSNSFVSFVFTCLSPAHLYAFLCFFCYLILKRFLFSFNFHLEGICEYLKILLSCYFSFFFFVRFHPSSSEGEKKSKCVMLVRE